MAEDIIILNQVEDKVFVNTFLADHIIVSKDYPDQLEVFETSSDRLTIEEVTQDTIIVTEFGAQGEKGDTGLQGIQGPKGDKGDTGSVNNIVKNEVPGGLVNGSNAVFTSAFNFIPESVEVFVCGIKLTIIDDYQTIGNNVIQLTAAPLATEKISINYLK